MKVLVIEDDSGIRYSLQVILEMEGDSSVLVDCGEEALEALKRESFDMVLLDLNTNGMSAREFVERLNIMCRVCQVSRPQIGLISGIVNLALEAQRMGVDFWIQKPFEIEDIQRRLAGFKASSLDFPIQATG